MHPIRYVASTPDKPAIIMGQSGEVVTFAQLDARANRLANLFRGLGLATGDCIAYLVENHPLVIELAFAASRSGLFYVPISTRLKSDELAYVIENSGAKAFFTTAGFASLAASVKALLPPDVACFIAGAEIIGYQTLDKACHIRRQ